MLLDALRRALLWTAACVPLAAWAGSDAAPLPGYWVKREHELNYVGYTSHYSCDGLRDTLGRLLRAAGARDDVKIVMACSNPFEGPSRIASATLTFYTLALAPPAPVAAGAPAVAAPGAWKRVALRAAHPFWLGAGDCELVEHFERELLPLFTTRNRVSHMDCVPHAIVAGGLSLAFEALAPPPRAAPAAAPRPQ